MLLDELPELIDIINDIIPDSNTNFISDEETVDMYETCIYIMEEFMKENPKIISEPDFEDIFDENIYELIHSHFEDDIFYTEEAEELMEEIIEIAKKDFYKYIMPPRSYSDAIILKTPDYDCVSNQLKILTEKPQPEQRTKEWYEFRHNLITASNAYKAFENQTTKNQLIYEKCQPLNSELYIDGHEVDNTNTEEITDDVKMVTIKDNNNMPKMVNVNSTLHWGQKYEPLSVKIYEDKYNTKVGDFGCIQHDTYKFIGASPDGINIDPSTSRYGRMLEIKNIVNREIDGIPKKEYWIQMQLQMEVCNLDECDFLETKFIEYPDISSYMEDTIDDIYEDDDGREFNNQCVSKDDKIKGIIIYFHTKEGKPFYCYKPLDIIHPQDISGWEDGVLSLYQSEKYGYTYMKYIYWKLEYYSCVLVCRNNQWFKDNIKEMEEIWSIIKKERVTGHEHRAPNRKTKKDNCFEISTSNSESSGNCLLQFNKETGKITIIKNDTNSEEKMQSTIHSFIHWNK
jgi:putative phage-type endonuclease